MRRTGAALSLERKLPLLISVFLVALTVGLIGAAYQEVRQSAELRGIDRLRRLAAQLAERLDVAFDQRGRALSALAADPAVIAALSDARLDTATQARARAALERLARTAADTPVVAEIRGVVETRRIATRDAAESLDEPVAAVLARLDSAPVAVGRLYTRGDSIVYWVAVRVARDGRTLGFVIQRRWLVRPSPLDRVIRDLSGNEDISIYLASGGEWTSLGRSAAGAPVTVDSTVYGPGIVRYARDDGSIHVAAHAPVEGTPIGVVAEVPYASLLDRPGAFLRRGTTVAILMLLVGTGAAWLVSRHITRPLGELTTAAEAIAAGNYAERVRVHRNDETGRLAGAFNVMAERVERSHDALARQIDASVTLAGRLDEANRAKADFLATMSHELRTPLNAIAGYVDLMQLGVRGALTDDQRHDLERIKYNQRHLVALISNILDFTRLDARRLTYDVGAVRIDVAAREALAAIAPLLDEKGIERECVGCDAPALAWADRARFEQILLNLLSNAVRFTPAGGRIRIVVDADDTVVRVTVRDTGMGIPAEKLGVIFEPFVQVESGLTRTVGGTGLGLTISRELARGMNGDLTVESVEGHGAMFTLTLPRVGVEVSIGRSEGATVATQR